MSHFSSKTGTNIDYNFACILCSVLAINCYCQHTQHNTHTHTTHTGWQAHRTAELLLRGLTVYFHPESYSLDNNQRKFQTPDNTGRFNSRLRVYVWGGGVAKSGDVAIATVEVFGVAGCRLFANVTLLIFGTPSLFLGRGLTNWRPLACQVPGVSEPEGWRVFPPAGLGWACHTDRGFSPPVWLSQVKGCLSKHGD